MLKKGSRITNKRLISKLFRDGKVYKNRAFVFRFLPAMEPLSQFVIITSKKFSKKAVERNHLRRQASNAIRSHLVNEDQKIVALILPKIQNHPIKYPFLEKGILDFKDYLSKLNNARVNVE